MTKTTTVQLCLMAVLAGCTAQGELEQRARRYFEIPTSEQVSAKTIRAAILNRVPLGSSLTDVYRYLVAQGIGRDALSSYYPLNDKGEIVCRVEYNPKTPDVVKNSFGIFFVIDHDQKLKDIQVQEWRTGL